MFLRFANDQLVYVFKNYVSLDTANYVEGAVKKLAQLNLLREYHLDISLRNNT